MVFLTPILLLGLLAAGIPLAIHWMRREQPHRLLFPTIRFLQKTPKKPLWFQHLQQIALLLLRVAVIVLLVVAFARPLITPAMTRLSVAAPQSAVILLDVSMSMRYGDHFARAREQALAVLDALGTGAEVALVGFADSAQLVRELGSDPAALAELIRDMDEAGFGTTRYYPNLQLADQLLSTARYAERVIYLISDFQQSGMAAADPGWKLAPGVALTTIDTGTAGSSNLVLTDLRLPQQLLEGEAEQQILARVRSTGSRHLPPAEVSLYLDGQLVEQAEVDFATGSEQLVSFNSRFDHTGTYLGEIRVSGDSFIDDNVRFFTVEVIPKAKVLLVNGEASVNWFDDEAYWFALAVDGAETSPFEVRNLLPAALDESVLRDSDVVVLLNVGNLRNNQVRAIADYVAAGGSLLLAPGDRVNAEQFNRQFAGLTPAQLQPPEQTGREEYLLIADYQQDHPIMAPLQTDWTTRFTDYWSLLPRAEADVLMRFDNAEPALVEQAVEAGRVILFASSLDLEWNNLALQGLFLPFVHQTLRYLLPSDTRPRSYQVGDYIPLDNADRMLQVVMVDAQGQSLTLPADSLKPVTRPGLYTVSGSTGISRYAVNIVPAEADFTRLPATTLHDAVINPDSGPAQSPAIRTARLRAELEESQGLWWYLLALVMLLLCVETLLANRTWR